MKSCYNELTFPSVKCAVNVLVVETEEVNSCRSRIGARGVAREVLSEGEDPVVVSVNCSITDECRRRNGVANDASALGKANIGRWESTSQRNASVGTCAHTGMTERHGRRLL